MKRIITSILLTLCMLFAVTFPAMAADPVPVESISLNQEEILLSVGKSASVKATVSPKNATMKKVTWSSSDENVATVSASGQVKGVGEGTATITAAAQDDSGAKASCTVTVVIPVKKITLSEKSIEMPVGVTWPLQVSITPEDATNQKLEWSSSKEDVAAVSSGGVITSKAKGSAKITAAATDGSRVKVSINVRVEEYDHVFLDLNSQTEELYSTVPGAGNIRVKTKNNTVEVTSSGIGTIVGAYGVQYWSQYTLTPVKPGADIVTFSLGGSSHRTKVYVAPEAFASSSSEAGSTIVGTSEEGGTLFLNIPWGSSYDDVKKLMESQNRTVNALAQRNEYLRAQIDGEFPVGNYTATHAAVSFSYDPEDADFKKNNSFFMGTLYFVKETLIDSLKQNIISVYGLDEGRASGEDWIWEKDGVTFRLTKKNSYVSLEVMKEDVGTEKT